MTVWPVIDYADIAAGTVSAESCDICVGAVAWSSAATSTATRPRLGPRHRRLRRAQPVLRELPGPGDDFFGSVGSKPEIYPIYWSQAQMEARQSDRMATRAAVPQRPVASRVRRRAVVRPDRDSLYPDRIRRRPEGANSNGLGTHLDPGTLDLWMTQAYQQAFRHLFDGTVEQYDPWDAATAPPARSTPASTMCSAFRTFQGWTALSDMDHDQGVLHTVPIPEAMGYLMLRPLLSDVADDDMCGVTVNQVFPRAEQWHSVLLEALTGIPDVKAGDSVWWHCDMIHSVAPVADQQGWGNVMYIPAAPWCPRNETYAASVREGVPHRFESLGLPGRAL